MHPNDLYFPGIDGDNASRREFLRRGAALSVAAAATPFALSLAAIGEASAATATDYKALVCIFLNGGNDYANTLVPWDQTNWGAYNSLRGNIAYSRDNLAATVLQPSKPLPGGVQYALAPELSALLPLFNSGAMASVLNIGALVEPTTREQYFNRSVALPPKLGSHNDQASFWQSSQPEGSTSGWGGRMGDLLASGNGNSTFTCVGTGGNAVFLSGRTSSQYQITSNGSIAIDTIKNNKLGGSAACAAALKSVMTSTRTHLMENEYTRICRRSIDSDVQVTAALAGAGLSTVFPDSSLGGQLKMVARLIAARGSLNVKRQVFMVSIGGFDNHSDLNKNHPPLLKDVGDSMAAFYRATVELGITDKVTAFTASEFGRTLLSNSSGSDHGWGSMHFVTGGAVRGKALFGTSPTLANNGPDDIGQGRLIPTTSVDQFAATLATWFGMSTSDQLMVLPNLKNYSLRNLGFLG